MIAPLNWGLGHASRCIPLISELQRQNHTVIIASSGASLNLLKTEFPELTAIELPDYDLKFSARFSIGVSVAMQGMKLNKRIKAEHRAIQKIVEDHQVDGIISDNRYGVYAAQIPSVLLTHQLKLAPKTPLAWFANVKINSFMQRFQEVWIPDEPDSFLTGVLSESDISVAKTYIGTLSRFSNLPSQERGDSILVTLSGTEPHRTQLEDKIITVFGNTGHQVKLFRGKPLANGAKLFPANFIVHAHGTTEQFEEELTQCKLLISRCGYSTIMDVIATSTPTLFITTPTQTEQEYLGDRLRNEFGQLVIHENELSLELLAQVKPFSLTCTHSFKKTLNNWVEGL